MKAYYEVPTTGDGSYANPYRPNLPGGYGSFVLCTAVPGPPTATILVGGNVAYHDVLKAEPTIAWLGAAASRPREATLPVAARIRARILFQAFYGQPVLPDRELTEREALDLALAHHSRSWAGIDGIDVVA